MKVIHLFRAGGASYGLERNLMCSLPSLARQGVDIVAVPVMETRLGSVREEFLSQLTAMGVRFVPIKSGGRLPFRLVRELSKVFRAEQPDIIHSHGYKTDLAMVFADAAGAARITTIHGWCSRSLKERFYEWVGVQCCKRMDATVAFCEDYRRRLLDRGLPDRLIRVVPVGTLELPAPPSAAAPGFREKWNIPRDAVLIAQIGRLSSEKGPNIFVRIAADIVRKSPNARFALLGDGPMEAELKAEARRLGLNDSLIFTGYVSEIGSALDAIDIVVNCSRTEAVPRVLLEAALKQRAIVGTAVGGVPDIIENNVTGILCPPGDTTALEAGITRLIGATELRRTLGKAACVRIRERFDIDACARRLIDVYESLAPARAARPVVEMPTISRKPPFKVIHVFSTAGDAYGVERTVTSMLGPLVRRGVDVHTVAIAETRAGGISAATLERLRACGCRYDVINSKHRFPLDLARQLRTIFEQHKPDIIHSHCYKTNLASMLSGSPGIQATTVHGWCSRSLKERFYEWVGVQCEKRMDGVIALCEDYRRRLERRGVPPRSIHVAHVGVSLPDIPSSSRDLRNEWAIGRDQTIVVQVGRLSPEKNPLLFIEIAKQLCRRLPNTWFVLVGDGPLLSRVQKEAAAADARILFAGYVKEIGDVFCAADVIVNCSLTEGLPGVLLEAGAMGVPVVATSVGGVPEIIEDGVTGILCPSCDAAALRDGIIRLIENPGLRVEMGAAAHRRIEAHFTVDACADRLIDLYGELLAARPVGPA